MTSRSARSTGTMVSGSNEALRARQRMRYANTEQQVAASDAFTALILVEKRPPLHHASGGRRSKGDAARQAASSNRASPKTVSTSPQKVPADSQFMADAKPIPATGPMVNLLEVTSATVR